MTVRDTFRRGWPSALGYVRRSEADFPAPTSRYDASAYADEIRRAKSTTLSDLALQPRHRSRKSDPGRIGKLVSQLVTTFPGGKRRSRSRDVRAKRRRERVDLLRRVLHDDIGEAAV